MYHVAIRMSVGHEGDGSHKRVPVNLIRDGSKIDEENVAFADEGMG